MSQDRDRLATLLPLLQCPRTGADLQIAGDGKALLTAGGEERYAVVDGVPDLLCPPARFHVDLPWYEPWKDLEALNLSAPEPLKSEDLPYHLDAHLAAAFGSQGEGRLVFEVGCGERQCEAYFRRRGFEYVGSDVETRGRGPHLLADAHNLPLQSESVDFCTSMAVYEHLVAPIVAAREGYRVLKPGGVFCGTAAFVYGFHDHASFHHMTHAGLLCILRTAGFEVERMWPDWRWLDSIPAMAFGDRGGALPWKLVTQTYLRLAEWTYTGASNLARRLVGKEPLDLPERAIHTAGSVSFIARKPASTASAASQSRDPAAADR